MWLFMKYYRKGIILVMSISYLSMNLRGCLSVYLANYWLLPVINKNHWQNANLVATFSSLQGEGNEV